ncbi:MAG: hypothetical protein AB8F78_16120 [Saprospiraceae bacterium]
MALRTILYIAFCSILLSSCQSLQENIEMNKELFLTNTDCFDSMNGIDKATLGVSSYGLQKDSMYHILSVHVQLKNGFSFSQAPDTTGIIDCLRPIVNKYPKLTHIGFKYKGEKPKDAEGLEAYDVLVRK